MQNLRLTYSERQTRRHTCGQCQAQSALALHIVSSRSKL